MSPWRVTVVASTALVGATVLFGGPAIAASSTPPLPGSVATANPTANLQLTPADGQAFANAANRQTASAAQLRHHTAVRVEATTPTTTPLPFTFMQGGYSMLPLTLGQTPYTLTEPIPMVDTGVHDANGVRKVVVNGVAYDHPVAQEIYGLENLESYRLTENDFYLTRAEAQADNLIATRVEYNGAWFYPYPFDFALHHNPSDGLMKAPWFSAMAQGMALDLFSRLTTYTESDTYRAAADATFESFLQPPSPTHPWVVHSDADQDLWLEEYPLWPVNTSDFTLNGHIFSLFGLRQYYLLSGDPRAYAMWDGALRTVAVNLASKFRNPNWYSNYCAAHKIADEHYHALVVWQMLLLHAQTGTPNFAHFADLLETDGPTRAQTPTILAAPSIHTAYGYRHGLFVPVTQLRLTKVEYIHTSVRSRIKGSGIYFQISGGKYNGLYLAEASNFTYALGHPSLNHYRRNAAALFPAGRVLGYRLDSLGRPVNTSTTLSRASTADVDGTDIINAIECYHVLDGSFAGEWVPIRTLTLH